MSDPAKHIQASIRYEVRLEGGPRTFKIRGMTIELAADDDAMVLVRMTLSGRATIDERIVGLIGGEWRADAREVINLREFLQDGGVIGLSKALA
jgi:hypothetical protein